MNRKSVIPTALVVTAATCFAALVMLVPGAPAAPAASDPGSCALPAWMHALTGHWGGSAC